MSKKAILSERDKLRAVSSTENFGSDLAGVTNNR